MRRSRFLSTLASRRPHPRRRVRALFGVVLVCAVLLTVQAATAPDLTGARGTVPPIGDTSPSADGVDSTNSTEVGRTFAPGNTLITVQTYGWFGANSGEAMIVTPNGTTVWTFDPPNSRVFDAEVTDDRTILVSVATWVPAERCPAAYRKGGDCVHNRVVELDPETNAVVWQYDWFDAFIEHHEVHDADRLPGGETAIIDMGNNRVFTVDREGRITWSWNASEHLGPGSAFRDEYGGPERTGPESDWTHMNDVDRLPNGNFMLSIRNFDTVLEVDPETNEIVTVVNRPGNTTTLNDQHNPQYLDEDTILVADSSNNRVVEIDTDTDSLVWAYDASETGRALQWPRDADRLPNGHTLVADSRNFRVVEIAPDGEVVWRYSLRERNGIVYEADRIGVPEESTDVPTHGGGPVEIEEPKPIVDALAEVESWAGFVFPGWVRLPELATMLVGLLAGVWLVLELAFGWLRGESVGR